MRVMTDTPLGCAVRDVQRWRGARCEPERDRIAEEVPVALLYNDEPHVVMMATPADLDDFALGFSLSEAVIAHADELESIHVQTLVEGIELRLRVPAVRAHALQLRQRNLAGRSGCGLCGTRALEDALRQPAAVPPAGHVDAPVLRRALAQLQQHQPLNAATGATHAAAWASGQGDIVLLREDVGRHNALDKLIGAMARARIDARAGFLVVTSRASYEMVQKAATAGIGRLVAISAPTALAIQLAETCGLALIGFARGDSHVVYAPRATLAKDTP